MSAELAALEAAPALDPAARRKLFRLVENDPVPDQHRPAVQPLAAAESDIGLAVADNIVPLFPRSCTQGVEARSCQPDATLLGISRLLSGPHGSQPATVAWAAMLMDQFTYGRSHDPDHYLTAPQGELA